MKSNTIEKRNLKFEQLSKAEKRVAICKDALKQLKTNRFKAKQGDYLYIRYGESVEDNNSFQKIFKKDKEIACVGCAMGSLFLSTTVLGNRSTVKDMENEGPSIGNLIDDEIKFSNKFNTIFTKNQLKLIEIFFENWGLDAQDLGYSEKDCRSFYHSYQSSHFRLIAILQNIVKNKGTFVPPRAKV